MNTYIKSPLKCDEQELKDFETLVRKGEEVASVGLTGRIGNAAFLLFLNDVDGSLIGVSGLKRPDPGYRAYVFQSAHSKLTPDDFGLELGWAYIVESKRGHKLSHMLVEELLPYVKNERVYATTREFNLAMVCTNKRYGFQLEGSPYLSENGQSNLLLFVR